MAIQLDKYRQASYVVFCKYLKFSIVNTQMGDPFSIKVILKLRSTSVNLSFNRTTN